MTAIVKGEQVIVDAAIPTAVPFVINGPAKIAGTGAFDVLAWNGVDYATVAETGITSGFIASAGKYAVTAAGSVTVVVTPRGRA